MILFVHPGDLMHIFEVQICILGVSTECLYQDIWKHLKLSVSKNGVFLFTFPHPRSSELTPLNYISFLHGWNTICSPSKPKYVWHFWFLHSPPSLYSTEYCWISELNTSWIYHILIKPCHTICPLFGNLAVFPKPVWREGIWSLMCGIMHGASLVLSVNGIIEKDSPTQYCLHGTFLSQHNS